MTTHLCMHRTTPPVYLDLWEGHVEYDRVKRQLGRLTVVVKRAIPQVNLNNKELQPITKMYFQWTMNDSSVCSPCLCVRVLTPIPAACDQKSAQWNCSSCSRVMAYESCHSVWGLISLLLALSRVFSLCTRQLQDYITSREHGLHVCVYVYFAICVCPVICCCFLHALWAS